MSYAIIETGGKQYRVEAGRYYDVELLSAAPNTEVVIDQVLFVNFDGEIAIGQPLLTGATVEASVVSHLKAKKVLVYKMKPKKKTRKKNGHRQSLTRIMINAIKHDGKTVTSEKAVIA
ncbi:MAG: 50S ribosomal protein L21 [Pseudanabaenaceae cyanobacterium]|jgi:large subunit ribosomal protein L21